MLEGFTNKLADAIIKIDEKLSHSFKRFLIVAVCIVAVCLLIKG